MSPCSLAAPQQCATAGGEGNVRRVRDCFRGADQLHPPHRQGHLRDLHAGEHGRRWVNHLFSKTINYNLIQHPRQWVPPLPKPRQPRREECYIYRVRKRSDSKIKSDKVRYIWRSDKKSDKVRYFWKKMSKGQIFF